MAEKHGPRALYLTVDVRESALLAALTALRDKLVAKNKPGIHLIRVETGALPVGDIKIHTIATLPATSAAHATEEDGSVEDGASSAVSSGASDADEAPQQQQQEQAVTLLLAERKSLADLAASISDGRYREQKTRLLEAVGSDDRTRAVYIIEGGTLGGDPDIAPGHSGVKADSLWGMIVNSTFRDRLSVLRTASTEETALLLIKTALLLASGCDGRSAAVAGAQKTPAAARNDLPGGLFACMLAQVPKCSLARAGVIATEFGSVGALCLALQSDRAATERRIADLKVDSRRVGPALAASVASVCCEGKLPDRKAGKETDTEPRKRKRTAGGE